MLPESTRSYPYEHQRPGSTFKSADSPAVACFSCASTQFREVYCLSKLYAEALPQPHLNTAGNINTIKHGLNLIYYIDLIRYSTMFVLRGISFVKWTRLDRLSQASVGGTDWPLRTKHTLWFQSALSCPSRRPMEGQRTHARNKVSEHEKVGLQHPACTTPRVTRILHANNSARATNGVRLVPRGCM